MQKEEILAEQRKQVIYQRISIINKNISKMSFYEREKSAQELKDLKKELETLDNKQYQKKIEELSIKLEHLKKRPDPICSGYIKYIVLP